MIAVLILLGLVIFCVGGAAFLYGAELLFKRSIRRETDFWEGYVSDKSKPCRCNNCTRVLMTPPPERYY